MSWKPTYKQKLLKYLLDRDRQWIPGYVIETPEVGGQAGTMRFRELRAEFGDDIFQCRPMKHGSAWEYRIVDPTK